MSYIRQLRKQHHITQAQLAEKLNVTQTSVSQWESGRNFPDIKTARKLADYFGASLDQILAPHSTATDGKDNHIPYIYADSPYHRGVNASKAGELEMKRRLIDIFDHLSLTAKARILERAEAYLEVELYERENKIRSNFGDGEDLGAESETGNLG
ncbi:MAG TPA: helix-turn-helix transcriptional regulator [Clostridiaceae bacterium]|nr:helix-turn-helix transcriptional regulator [Clostridiaceae bacterium]